MKIVHNINDATRMCKICQRDNFDNLYKHLSECHHVKSLYEYDEVVKVERRAAEKAHNLTLPAPGWVSKVDKLLDAIPIAGEPVKFAAPPPQSPAHDSS